MRGNQSELAPGRKSPRCHVNTPLVTALTGDEIEVSIPESNSPAFGCFQSIRLTSAVLR